MRAETCSSPHRDEAGALTGFEVKNRGFTGFAAGGTKSAWQSAARDSDRALVVTESAIDALSYHQLHRGSSEAARYLSTAGAPSTTQLELLERFFARLPRATTIVAAVDSDEAGHKIASRIEALTRRVPHLGFQRDAPRRSEGLERRPSTRRARLHPVADERPARSRRSGAMTPAA